jgi:hypothetical protein
MPATSGPVLTVRVRCEGRLTPKSAGPQLFFSPVRVLCGSGQQRPFLAPAFLLTLALEGVGRWHVPCGVCARGIRRSNAMDDGAPLSR